MTTSDVARGQQYLIQIYRKCSARKPEFQKTNHLPQIHGETCFNIRETKNLN
jgi:hypothetical protein